MKPVTYSHIWKIAYPILVSLVAEHLIMMTDTAFLGRVGEVELGASALAGVFFLAFFMIGFGFSMGGQILVGRRNGEKRHTQIGQTVIQGNYFLLFLALLSFLLTRALAPLILRNLITSEAVYHAAISYLSWRSYGFFFIFVTLMLRGFFVGIEQTRILTLSSFIMVGVNVVLNYLLIFGKYGFPRMGIGGAALASSLAEMVAMVFLVWYTWRHVDLKKYGFNRGFRLRLPMIRQIMNVSVWMMIQYVIGVSIWFMFFVAIEHLGERAIAISNLARSLVIMIAMPIFALSSAAVSVTSNLMGAGQPDAIRGACLKVIQLGYLIALPVALAVAVFPELFLRIYSDQADLIESSIFTIRLCMTSFLIAVPGCILFQTISGTGNTKTAMFLDLVPMASSAIFVYVCIYRLRIDVSFCWLNEHIYWGVMLVVSWLYMRYANWQNKQI